MASLPCLNDNKIEKEKKKEEIVCSPLVMKMLSEDGEFMVTNNQDNTVIG